MARSEARLSVSIWDDADFLALTPGAQRAFMFLISQRDLAHDGVLALRERRWSKSAAGLTRADVERDLEELAAARFVVVDEDAEELLVRSFIRRDKVYRQPNVLRAAQDHLELVTSPVIRAAIAAELRRIVDSGELKEEPARIVAEMLAELDPSGKGSGNPSQAPPEGVTEGHATTPLHIDNHSEIVPPCETTSERVEPAPEPTPKDVSAGNKGSENPSPNPTRGAPGEKRVVTAVSTSPSPLPLSPNPSLAPQAPATPPASPKTKRGTRLPDDFTVTDAMKEWFAKNCPGVNGLRETEKFRNHFQAAAGQKGVKLDWVATWRNWMLTAAERGNSPTTSSRTTGANRHIDRTGRDDNPFRDGANATYASKTGGTR